MHGGKYDIPPDLSIETEHEQIILKVATMLNTTKSKNPNNHNHTLF